MTEAVFIPSIAMWASMAGIAVIGIVGGVILYISERIADKHRVGH